jgi:hypothetical protein
MKPSTAPNIEPDGYRTSDRPALVPDPPIRLDNAIDPRSFDATQGRKIGAGPFEDSTQGRQLGSDPYDDATRGR